MAVYATPPFLPDDDEDLMAQLGPGQQQDPFYLNHVGIPQAAPPQVAAIAQATPAIAAPTGPGTGYTDALNKLEGMYGDRPTKESPKWWQRALGSAAGFGAGWSNAASRTKHPIDIAAMKEDVLYPGYDDKLGEWKSRVTPQEAITGLEGKKDAAWWSQKRQQSEEEYKGAMAEQARQHGAYWADKASREQNQWKIEPKSGRLYNTITGETHDPAATPESRKASAMALGADEGQANYYALNGNLAGYGSTLANPQSQHNLNPADVLLHPQDFDKSTVDQARSMFAQMHREPQGRGGKGAGAGGIGTRAQFKQVDQKKNDRMIKAQSEADKRIRAIRENGGTPDQIQAELDGLTNTKQQLQDDFEGEVADLGGEPSHYDFYEQQPRGGRPAPTGKAAPAAPKAAAPAPAAPKAATPAITEGTIIRSKSDPSKRMVFKGGKWQPL